MGYFYHVGAGLALYLHFPYCRSRCTYCDFNAHAAPETPEPQARYIAALLTDIANQPDHAIETIFLGGGTPSLNRAQDLVAVLEACRRQFRLSPQAEVTMEANPGTVDEAKLAAVRAAGINRLSLGVQSFEPHLLKLLNRIHDVGEVEEAVAAARRVGFDNLSLDLIYGLPQQTVAGWEHTLTKAIECQPEHLSVYQLTVEPSTRLEAQIANGELSLPEEEVMLAMDALTQTRLATAGYRRYEISNWSRPGRDCRHNLIYWRDEQYLGLGCGAVSYLDGWRSKRIMHPHYYCAAIESGRNPLSEGERLGTEKALKDTVMLGLRTLEGLPLERLRRRYPELDLTPLLDFFASLPPEWVTQNGEVVRLTRAGADLSNEVFFRLMDTALTLSCIFQPQEVA
ncbi:MAG: radical SAM family heme chaperone HemW [Vulcanimicrobiota bacterium]